MSDEQNSLQTKQSNELNFSKPAPKKEGSKVSKTVDKLKKVKNIEIIIALIAIAIMLIIYFSSKVGTSEKSKNASMDVEEDYCKRIERQLSEQLSKLKNAGQVSVIINWESSVEAVIAYSTNEGANSSSSTPQIISSGGTSSPIVLKEVYPKALGVVIFCQGGDNIGVKLDIINAVSTLLSITPEKICVLTMSK